MRKSTKENRETQCLEINKTAPPHLLATSPIKPYLFFTSFIILLFLYFVFLLLLYDTKVFNFMLLYTYTLRGE